MALDTIQKKLQRNAYPTMTTLESDFKRLVQNAKDYNAPKSDIYEDAERVRKLVYNYMKTHNPEYSEDPSYVSFPTPIMLANGEIVENGSYEGEDVKGEDEPQARQSSERPKRSTVPQTSEAPSDRKASVAPTATTGDGEDDAQMGGDLDFTGLGFQEAQQKMVSHLLHYTDEEYVSLPFVCQLSSCAELTILQRSRNLHPIRQPSDPQAGGLLQTHPAPGMSKERAKAHSWTAWPCAT